MRAGGAWKGAARGRTGWGGAGDLADRLLQPCPGTKAQPKSFVSLTLI